MKTKTKLIMGLTAVAAFISAPSFAGTMGPIQTNYAHGGWVIGGDVGYGYLSTQEEQILAPVSNSIPPTLEIQSQHRRIGQVVGGGYAGYNWGVSERLLMGLEAGYKYLGDSRYNSFALDTQFGQFLSNNIKVNQQAVDFLLTGRFYVAERVSFIGKAGAAYVRAETKDNSNFNLGGTVGGLITDPVFWRIRPELAVGVGYAATPRLDINLMYTHVGGVDTNVTGALRFYNSVPDRTPAVFEYNALTAGFSYTFG